MALDFSVVFNWETAFEEGEGDKDSLLNDQINSYPLLSNSPASLFHC